MLVIAVCAPLGACAGAAAAGKQGGTGQGFSASALLPFGAGLFFVLNKNTCYGCICMYENQEACMDKVHTSFRIVVTSEDWRAIQKGFSCLSGISSLSNRKAMIGTPLLWRPANSDSVLI